MVEISNATGLRPAGKLPIVEITLLPEVNEFLEKNKWWADLDLNAKRR